YRSGDFSRRLERSTLVVLFLLILFFQIFPKRSQRRVRTIQSISVAIVVQEIPATRQTIRRGQPRPEKPTVPLAVEDPDVPEDATIAETDVNWEAGDSPWGRSELTAADGDTVLPRPRLQVMPDYPDEAKKLKRHGVVRLLLHVDDQGEVVQVIVSQNTTGSDACAQAAVEAAERNRYHPGLIEDRPSEMWVICEYGFEPE
ncbi:TonB family protein, partial [candidate division KSB1 bacterium]|nr:TonB family protein [candidate division KSB1 bacterium]